MSFPAEPTDEDLAPFDHANVFPTPQPEYDQRTQRLEEGTPILMDDRYQQVWQLRPATEEELAAWDVAHAPEPRWIEFSTALMTDPGINAMLGSVLAAAPAIYGGLTVGLSEVSKGAPQLFLNAWSSAKTVATIDPAVVVSLQAMAAAHDLPVTFREALA